MSEDSSLRLYALRVLERVQLRDLARTRRWIAEEEGHVAEIATRRPPPPPPEWVVERGIDARRSPVAIHAGDCPMAGHGRPEGLAPPTETPL
ncbi:DUF6233 domain-containing protein [Streptomyces sp. NPDC088182]|uniref:DUF6233 domain-containing protein n=1 Tax=Streptomyces sp. NPDC088182 TaxID=3365838 RepID=UPI003813512B